MEPTVLAEVGLGARHEPTRNTRHVRGGVILPPPVELQIVRHEGGPGFRLLHLDADGQVLSVTWHETLDAGP